MSERTGSEMPPSDIGDLLGAYALDAVDPSEREIVERHLAADPAARAEVDEMRETAAMLASLPVGDEGAPIGLWDRISGAIHAPGATAAGETSTRHDGEAHADATIETATVVSIGHDGKANANATVRSVPARWAVTLAAAAALVIAVLAVQVVNHSPSRAGDIAAAYDHAVANGATKVPLQSAGVGTGVAAEIALQRDGTGYLRNTHLAALPTGKTYQLWALVKRGTTTRAISAGVLGPRPDAVAFHLAAPPDGFAITIESTPGVVRSKNDPVAQGSLGVHALT